MIPFADCFWPDDTTIISDTAWHISMGDDVAMNAIQTALAALKEGSSLAAKFPFIAPIAGLLLQALTMRDVRVTHIPSDNILMSVSPGGEAIYRRMQNSDAQTCQNREDHCRFVRKV
jgi:hypothetical protein